MIVSTMVSSFSLFYACVCVRPCVCVCSDEVVMFPQPSVLLLAGKRAVFNANVYYNRVMLDVL